MSEREDLIAAGVVTATAHNGEGSPQWVIRARANGHEVTDALPGGRPPVDAFVADPAMTVHDRARSYLDGQILSSEACIERLAGIQNDAVRVDAQHSTLARMRQEVEVWKYLRAVLDCYPEPLPLKSVVDP
jgi:hypothetical protein